MITRQFAKNEFDAALLNRENTVEQMINYFSRRTEFTQIKNLIKIRYGYEITKNETNNQDTYERVKKGKFNLEVDADIYETLSVGFGEKVSRALATLFTESGNSFVLQHDSKDDLAGEETFLNEYRKNGNFKNAIVKADKLSCKIGSSALFVNYTNSGLNYRVLSPADVRVFYSAMVIEDDTERLPDKADIEDAYCVVIRLSEASTTTYNYLAIFGQSDTYPQGRYVIYDATNAAVDVPEVGTSGIYDYEISGKICNPLTYVANLKSDDNAKEYPLVIFDGGLTEQNEVLPYTTNLYNNSLEIDIAASHLLSTSQSSAVGTDVITRDPTANNQPLPPNLRGKVALFTGQTLQHFDLGASQSLTALETLDKLIVHVASGYSVPDYLVISSDYTVEASSGVALQIKTRPLQMHRQDRIETNSGAVNDIFKIEKSLISLYSTAPENILNSIYGCRQIWQAGELQLPENRKDSAQRLITLLDKGVIDTVGAIREYYQCSTDAEAIKIYDKMRDRQTEFPPLLQAEKPTKKIGLLNV